MIRTDYHAILVPNEPRPGLRVAYLDPVFGTVVTRVTDPNMALNDGDDHTLGLRHEYARYAGVNADGTKAVVVVIGGLLRGGYRILELATGRLLQGPPVQGGDAEASWHLTDPNLFFFRSGNALYHLAVDTGQLQEIRHFNHEYLISTNQEGRPSDDWHYHALIGYPDSSMQTADLIVADLQAGTNVSKWKNSGVPNWVSMSPSGEFVVVQWADSRGTQLYDRSLVKIRTLIYDYPHCDFAFDEGGSEVLVYQASSGGAINDLGCPRPPNGQPIASVRLADGVQKILLGDCNTSLWEPVIAGTYLGWEWFGCHFSGIASRAHPGWCLVSTYTDPHNAQQPMSREIFWLKLDGSGEVKRIAHHHSDQDTQREDKDYWAEPHATSSWDGNTVVFSSTWGSAFEEYDLYTLTGEWW